MAQAPGISRFRSTLLAAGVILATSALAVSSAKSTARTHPSAPAAGRLAEKANKRPNVVVILLDDIGYADAGTFGGPIPTPNIDKLAATGLRYNNFHTSAMCSPTRAALLTGRNHHQVGFGYLAESKSDEPGYNALWPKDAGSIAAVLRANGYATAAIGKWHNTPPEEQTPKGPFDRWPTGLGFDYFYGFQGWSTSQWEPELYRGTRAITDAQRTDPGKLLTTDLVDDAIKWLNAPRKDGQPSFLYLAPGAAHGPHHVAKEWIDKYRGAFDQGWDVLREQNFKRQKALGVIPADTKLTPRPAEIPAWSSLSDDQHRVLSRQMEVYAGMVAHTDYEIGRLLTSIRSGPQGDNTLVFLIVGDNGAAGEGGLDGQMDRHANGWGVPIKEQLKHIDELGGPGHDNVYSGGWAWAGTAPFQWFKSVASHLGSERNPLIVSWPKHVRDPRAIRSQFTDVNDVAATIYGAVGVTMPNELDGVPQRPLEGQSFARSFLDPKAPSLHHTQYFEIMGHRAIYHDGWIAAARAMDPWTWRPTAKSYEQTRWELYNVAKDYSEAEDLAAKYPAKLAELKRLFDSEAKRNRVYPLTFDRPTKERPLSTISKLCTKDEPVPARALEFSPGAGFRLQTSIEAARNLSGVLFSFGGTWEGFALYAENGKLVFENRYKNAAGGRIEIDLPASGAAKIDIAYDVTDSKKGSGIAHVDINGKPAGTLPMSFKGSYYFGYAIAGKFHVQSPIAHLKAPFPFTGIMGCISFSSNPRLPERYSE